MEHFVKNLVTDRFLRFSKWRVVLYIFSRIEFGKWQKNSESSKVVIVFSSAEKFTGMNNIIRRSLLLLLSNKVVKALRRLSFVRPRVFLGPHPLLLVLKKTWQRWKKRHVDTGKNEVTTTDTEEELTSVLTIKSRVWDYNGITQLRLFVCSGM